MIITAYGPDQGYLQSEQDHGTPLVFIDRVPNGLLADVVLTDNRFWAAVATEHLIDHGHRRIAFLGDDLGIPTARDRRQGYERAMSPRVSTCRPATAWATSPPPTWRRPRSSD